MKKITPLIALFILVNFFGLRAQTINNNGFEQLNSDGTLSNWGNVYLFNVWIDSTGTHTDSIVFDGYFYSPTSDSHSGNSALELRNAWNFTTNTGIAGAAAVDNDSIFTSWGTLNLVPVDVTPFAPSNFGFYYKYAPVNGDSAYAQIALWDSSGYQIAEGNLIISGPANSYTLAYANINYISPGVAAFYSLMISNFYTAEPGIRQPGFGSRLVVDDVGFDFSITSEIKHLENGILTEIYPNPASEIIYIQSNRNDDVNFNIKNILGEIVWRGMLKPGINSLPLGQFENGIYILNTSGDRKNECYRFIIDE